MSPQSAGAVSDEMTIDQLSSTAGVPTRTIREYQRLGLLNPPRREGRIGLYDADHRARLMIVARLQERGYSLAAVGDLIQTWEEGQGLGSVLGVNANPAVLDETPTLITLDQLKAAVPALADPALVVHARSAGLVHDAADGHLAIRSVAALDLVALATEAGMPTGDALEIVATIRTATRDIARTTVDAFIEHLWPPQSDRPDLAATVSRGRLLLAQAAASLVVHELGLALYHHADTGPGGEELKELVDRIAIGATRSLTTTDDTENRT